MNVLWRPKTLYSWQVTEDLPCWRLFQTIIVIRALLQLFFPINAFLIPSLCLVSKFPLLPKDCFLLITILELSSAVLLWPVHQHTTFIIYELKYLQTQNWDHKGNAGLTSVQWVRKASPLLVGMRAAVSPPSAKRHTNSADPLTVCCQGWQVLSKLSEGPSIYIGFLKEWGYFSHDLTCLESDW